MKAVKDYRKSEGNDSLMEFLDKLSNLSSREKGELEEETDKVDLEANKSVKNLSIQVSNKNIEDIHEKQGEFLNVNHSCQATGLQDDSEQVDFESNSEEDIKFKDQKVGESLTDFIPIDEIFITQDTQTMPTSEIFNEVEEYIKNIHEKEILNQTISKEETLLRENARQEALKQDILKLKLETNQNRSSSIISFKEEEEEYEDSFEKLEEYQEKEIQTHQDKLIVENQQTQTNNLIKTTNENVQVAIKNELKDTAINTEQKDLSVNMFSAEICEPETINKPILKTVSIETIKTGVSKAVETNILIQEVESLESGSSCSYTNKPKLDKTASMDLISIFDSTKKKCLSQSIQVDSENIKNDDKNDQNYCENDTNCREIHKDDGNNKIKEDDDKKSNNDENFKDGILCKLIAEENEDCRYGILLNSIYGVLFTIVFLGLNMNYTC
nr:protein PFC0760c-like [Onthophagus taurus]